jgi:hypothetical protein
MHASERNLISAMLVTVSLLAAVPASAAEQQRAAAAAEQTPSVSIG